MKMFTKAYVLTATEFRELCIGFFELCAEHYASEIENKELTEDMVRDYLVGMFGDFLANGGVDLIVAYMPKEKQLVEIDNGEKFVRYVEDEYGDLVDVIMEF
jgi:hypothetical protein